jgi:hypothetical protein
VHAQRGDRPLAHVGRPHGHPVAGLDAGGHEGPGGLVHRAGDLGEAQADLVVDEALEVAEAGRSPVDDRGDRQGSVVAHAGILARTPGRSTELWFVALNHRQGEQMADEWEYAERMFPEPVDLGIAEEDRAVSSVPYGTSSHLEGGRGEGSAWYEGGGAVGERAVQGITIYPPTPRRADPGRPFEPVKIGILIDMDLNQLLADWIDPTILAIEDALNEGVWAAVPVQLVIADARGLPRENYRKVIDGYRWLVEQGCVVVLGPMISDNCLVVQDTVNELGVACIGWTGAHRFSSEYCFTVANGDIPTEGVMCAQWLAARGIEKVGMFWEAGLVGARLRRLLPGRGAPPGPQDHARGQARTQPQGAPGRPGPHARAGRRGDLLRRLRLRHVPLRRGVPRRWTGTRPG